MDIPLGIIKESFLSHGPFIPIGSNLINGLFVHQLQRSA